MHLRLERWASPISPLRLVTDTKGILRALEYADFEPRRDCVCCPTLEVNGAVETGNTGPLGKKWLI